MAVLFFSLSIPIFNFIDIKKNSKKSVVLKVVGISSCPKDASVDVKSICDYISHKDGGLGCVRDVIEQVMRIHNKWI